MFGGQGLFGGGIQQQQPQQPSLFGQQPLQPQLTQQQPNFFGGGTFQQPQTQQQQAIQFQNPQQPGPSNKSINEMIDDLNKKKNRINTLYDEINQANQKNQLPQTFQKELEDKLKMLKSQEILLSTKALAIEQRSIMQRLDEFITALGLVDKIVIDGVNSLREDNNHFRDLQSAEQTLGSIHQRIQYTSSENRYLSYQQSDQSEFQIPQNYEYQIISRLNADIENINQAIQKLYQFHQACNNLGQDFDGYDFDEIVDMHLQKKLQRLANLSNLLYLLQQKIRHLQSRVENFRTKSFAIDYPEKNKKLNDFHSIDLAKDQLQNILSKELNIN